MMIIMMLTAKTHDEYAGAVYADDTTHDDA